MKPTKLEKQDMETKLAQIMILGSSLLSRPAFTSLDQSIRVANNKISQIDVVNQLFESVLHPVLIKFESLKPFAKVSEKLQQENNEDLLRNFANINLKYDI